MEFLKDIIKEYVEDEKKVDEVVDKINKKAPEYYVPKAKFNDLTEEHKLTKQQLDEQKKTVEELGKKAESLEEYESQLEELRKKNKEIEEKTAEDIKKISTKTQMKELLFGKAHQDAIDLLVDRYSESAELGDDKTLKNAEDLLKKMKEEKSGLFIETKENSKDKDEHKNKGGEKSPAEMDESEYAQYFNERESKRVDL